MTGAFQDEDDLFGEDLTLDLAFRAWQQHKADRLNAEKALDAIALADDPENDVATAARYLVSAHVDRIRTLEATSCRLIDDLMMTPLDQETERAGIAAKIATNAEESRRMEVVVRSAAAAAFTPDVEPSPLPEAPLPDTRDWTTTKDKVRADVLQWVASHREPKRDVLMLRPSPSVGKTTSMIEAALDSVDNRKRVIFAVRTKEMIREDDDKAELRNRIVGTRAFTRLHVIYGRDEDNCKKFDNVETVADHGYSPGRTVCLACDYHPRNALPAKMEPCKYFNDRIVAQRDVQMARRGLHEYPLILTTHAGLATAANSGGGMFSKLWAADLAIIDEDPSDAFETEIALDESHIAFDASRNPNHQVVAVFTAVLRAAVKLATKERRDAERRGFFIDPNVKARKPDPIHSPHGSNYSTRNLHRLLRRALEMIYPNGTGRNLRAVLSDAGSVDTPPGVGELLGFTSTTDLNNVLPHHGLKDLANLLFDEVEYARVRGSTLAKEISGQDLPTSTPDERDRLLDEQYPTINVVHQVRLVGDGAEWKFLIHHLSDLDKMDANIILGDAYAHEEHYRSLFNKPRPTDGSPDPVTIVQHIAHFPPGSIVLRIRSFSTIGHLKGNWEEHCTDIAEVLRFLAGQRVLIYGHLKLRKQFQEFMDKNKNFGLKDWAYEHWWGGRGKDQYRDWDAVVTISEPVINIDAVVSICNARAMRDVKRAGAAATVDMLAYIPRVQPDQMKHGVAHGVRHPTTHPRIVHEHERQNMNEQAQALHRVRGLIKPKKMIVFGQEIEFTPDLIAASSTFEHPRSDRGDLVVTNMNGFVTSEEMLSAMETVEERFGVFSPLFAHAFSSLAFQVLLDSLVISNSSDDSAAFHEVAGPVSSDFNFKTGPTTSPAQSLLERVWTPFPRWEDVGRRVRDTRSFKDALAAFALRCPTVGTLAPCWRSSGGRGFSFYSRTLPLDKAIRVFAELMNNQYGTTVQDVVMAPNAKSFVPF